MKPEYTTLDINRAFDDIQREKLRDWMSRGYIVPSIPAKGTGTKALFSRSDLCGLALFKFLIETGFGRAEAAQWVREFIDREKTEPPRQKAWFIFFRMTTPDGDKKVSAFPLAGDDYKIDVKDAAVLPQGKRIPAGIIKDWGMKPDESYDMFTVVNFKKICADVDRKLEGLKHAKRK